MNTLNSNSQDGVGFLPNAFSKDDENASRQSNDAVDIGDHISINEAIDPSGAINFSKHIEHIVISKPADGMLESSGNGEGQQPGQSEEHQRSLVALSNTTALGKGPDISEENIESLFSKMNILNSLCESKESAKPDGSCTMTPTDFVLRENSPISQSRYSEYSDCKLQDRIAQFSQNLQLCQKEKSFGSATNEKELEAKKMNLYEYLVE